MIKLNFSLKLNSLSVRDALSVINRGRALSVVSTIVFSLAALTNAFAEDEAVNPNLEQTSAKHLGVASCAASTCHGSTLPFVESNVLQNEFRTWNELDPHARAYQTLLSPESKKIARNLGLASAETSDVCLSCHADNVAPTRHGDDFDITEGVGCETCHGGAENYIESHTKASHQENLEAGLSKTENPTVRAELCVSCHIGNHTDRKITHTIMGAGHPRLSFELNTFSSIQPAHYQVDSDYTERKGPHNELQIWAIGQLVASEQLLTNIREFPRSGLFPELVHMDCLGCHQPMSKIDWAPNPLTNLAAGSLRYNDAHLLMSYQLAKTVSPSLANEVLGNTQAFLNGGASSNNSDKLASKLLNNIEKIRTSLEGSPLSQEQANAILNALINNGLSASHQGYASAEQSAMAINSVLRVIITSQDDASNKAALLGGVETMFKGVNNPERYRPEIFVAGLRKIQTSIK
ncbi:MAG: hypothetical protein JKX81_03560 [Arenicella sp.]|nr:hypothetical protein [Arenicella sp.]